MNILRAIAFGVIACVLVAHSAWSADERRWKTPKAVESHESGDAFTPQFAFDHNGNAVAVWLLSDGENGQVLASRYTVITKTWAAPVQMDASGGSATSPQVAVDAAGNALVVWSQSSGIQARRYPASGPLGAITPLQSVSGSSASPQIAYGANGIAFAIWHQLSNGSTQVWANRFVTDHWEGAAQVETNAGDGLFPQIAVDAGGNAVAVWSQSTGSHTDILANRYTVSNHSWNVPAPIETNVGNTFAPQVAVEAGGNARAVWFEFDTNPDANGSRNRIWSSRYTVSSNSWSAALVESNPGSATAPQVTVDTNGNAVAVWSQVGASVTNIWSSRAATGSDVWDAPALLETDDTGNAQSPSIAMDATGNALAVWQQTKPNSAVVGIYAARYISAATLVASWERTRLIGTDDRGDAVSPRVAFDVNGGGLAVWSQSDGTRASVISRSYSNSQWLGATLIEHDDLGSAVNPAIALDAAGNAMAVWAQFSTSNPYATSPDSIRWNRYAGGGWGNVDTVVSQTSVDLPDVAFDARGDAVVVWQGYVFAGVPANMARRYTAGTWGAQTQLSQALGQAPHVVTDTKGNALVVWPYSSVSSVSSKSYSPDTGWGAEVFVPSATRTPQVVFDAQGNGMAVWELMISGWGVPKWSSTIYTGRYTPQAGWTVTQSFQTSVWATSPRIAIDTSGNAIAVWEQGDGWLGVANVCSSVYTPNGGWSAPVQMNSGTDAHRPTIAFDTAGNALMVWAEYGGPSPGTTTIRSKHFTKGSGWDPGAAAVVAANPIADYSLSTAGPIQLAFDADGNALTVWSQPAAGYRYDLWSNRYQPGAGWGTARLIESNDAGSATLPRMVLDANGNALVVWQQSDGTRTNIWANRFE